MFGRETLLQGPVLDVAGGKGELAFQLMALNGCDTVVVDPRPLRCEPFHRLLLKGVFHRAKDAASTVDCAQPALDAALNAPRHVATLFTSQLVDRSLSDAMRAAIFARLRAHTRRLSWTTTGLTATTDTHEYARDRLNVHCVRVPDDVQPSEAEWTDWREAELTLESATMVVGMHLDQAAEAAVDFAVARGLPFAVVPCCVYQKEFSRRRFADGRRVTTYEDLLEYLQQKHPAIERATLPIDGKNQVLFMRATLPTSAS